MTNENRNQVQPPSKRVQKVGLVQCIVDRDLLISFLIAVAKYLAEIA